ncbi:MAG: SDR family oxidoreductase [Alphaproteobacteria bacterium]|nr:SDR family oxidoreductase [Alphaproteobacteria bacterium]
MAGRLEGKVAIVTGAGASGPGMGNGKACAIHYAREGAKVFALDISAKALAETEAFIKSENNTVIGALCDVTDSNAIARMVDACLAAFGRVDVLHNNVGLLDIDGPVALPEATWDRVIDTNVKSMFLTCKHVLPVMERQRKGAIVNISSVAAIRAWGTPALAYNTSKAAILQLTRSVALEYARKGIRANVILPGVIDTPLINEPLKADHTPEEIERVRAERHNMIPLGRMGDPFEIAKAAAFLASDDASYITGAELIVDGGLTSNCIPSW